jgi:hypothetical protein
VVSLTVVHAAPTLTSVVPNTINGGQDYPVTLNGVNIHPTAVVVVGSLPDKTPVSVSPTNDSLVFNLTSSDVATLKGAQNYPFAITVKIKNATGYESMAQNITVNAPSGTTGPGSFSVTSTSGTNSGELDVAWSSAGGTAPVAYVIRGIPRSVLLTMGNLDATIDAGEFDTFNAGVWVYNQTDPINPFTYMGTAGTNYCFAGKATNTVGSSYSTTGCGVAKNVQSPPGSFTVSGTAGSSPGEIDVSWTDAGGLPLPRYTLNGILKSDPIMADGVIDSTEFENPNQVWAASFQTTSPYSFAGIPNTEYCFAVKAQNLLGTQYSNTVCVVAKDNAPPQPSAPPSGGGGGGGGGGGSGGGGGGSGGGGSGLACQPTLELCDGIDNDCDNQIDEGCEETLPENSNTCTNGQYDVGELGIDCGGVCSQWCVETNPIPSSFYGFVAITASPLLLFLQLITFLVGGASFAG